MQSWVRMKQGHQVHLVIITEAELQRIDQGSAIAKAKQQSAWNREPNLGQSFCEMNYQEACIHLHLVIPTKENSKGDVHYQILVWEEMFVIISDDNRIADMALQLLNKTDACLQNEQQKERTERTVLSIFLENWFLLALKDDLEYLQTKELQIAKMEELILEGKCPEFNTKMLPVKKQLARFFRYYNQLLSMEQEMASEKIAFFTEADMEWLECFRDRCNLLAQETQFTREYIMQVQEVYQSEIEIRQNDVMKALTMVTTICFPLSLIAGWYGMNFRYMPEIYSVFGYPIVIAVSVLIVVISLIIFKKKKFW